MSNFDYMNFTGGASDEFVVPAGKFSAEEAIKLFVSENDAYYKKPTLDKVSRKHVRWYPRVPEWCGYDGCEEGCYTYCKEGERGSFPVWVISYADVEEEELEEEPCEPTEQQQRLSRLTAGTCLKLAQ